MASTKNLVKFAKFATKASFEAVKANYEYYIVFIEDTKQIYTHGNYYGEDSSEYTSILNRLTTQESDLGSGAISITTDLANLTKTTSLLIDTNNPGNVILSQSSPLGLTANVDLSSVENTIDSVSGDVLSLDDKVLSTVLSLSYDSTNKKIKLLGKSNAVVSEISAADFVKDGILDSVSLVTTAESGVTTATPYLKFVFNTDSSKDPIRVSVKDLVDVYTGANVKLTGYTESTATYTAPVATDTVNAAIAKLAKGISDAKSAGVTSFGGKTGAITVTSGSTTNGAVNFAVSSSNVVSGTVYGLKSAAFTESTAYATAAQGTKADSALQSISKGTDGSYVTTTIGTKANNSQTVGVAVTVQSVSTSSSTAKGLAEASDVKSYVDDLLTWEEF